jgi:hypothetical protein
LAKQGQSKTPKHTPCWDRYKNGGRKDKNKARKKEKKVKHQEKIVKRREQRLADFLAGKLGDMEDLKRYHKFKPSQKKEDEKPIKSDKLKQLERVKKYLYRTDQEAKDLDAA